MVRIEPFPTNTPFVIVLEDPGEAFNVCLANVCLHFVHLGIVLDKEFSCVIAFSVALFAKFNDIHIFLDFSVLFHLNLS